MTAPGAVFFRVVSVTVTTAAPASSSTAAGALTAMSKASGSSLKMVRVTSSGSGMAAFDTAPDTRTTSVGSATSSSTVLIVTVPVLAVAFAAKRSTRLALSSKSSSVAGATGVAEIVTVKATGEAGDTVAVTVTGVAFSRSPSSLSCSVTSSPGGIATVPRTSILTLARIHRWTGMDGVRTAEGGEGVTGAMIRARIWVAGRLGGGLQALLGAPMAAYSGCGERDGGIGHGKRRSRTVLARVCGDVGLAGGSVADGRRQAGSGMARSRARARLNCSSQGQRRGRCRVNRRAERVIRPAKAKTRRLRVLVVTVC